MTRMFSKSNVDLALMVSVPQSAFSLMHPLRRPNPRLISCLAAGLLFFAATAARALDSNGNQMSDVWELIFNAQGLLPSLDTDGDGFLNVQEALAGTDPFDLKSHPTISIVPAGTNSLLTTWNSAAGKLYDLQKSDDLASWQTVQTMLGNGGTQSFLTSLAGETNLFFHLRTSDQPSENAQLSTWEKVTLGFSATSAHTDRFDQTDISRIIAGIAPNAANRDHGQCDQTGDERALARTWRDCLSACRWRIAAADDSIHSRRDGDGRNRLHPHARDRQFDLPARRGARSLAGVYPGGDANDSEPNETITVTLQPGSWLHPRREYRCDHHARERNGLQLHLPRKPRRAFSCRRPSVPMA